MKPQNLIFLSIAFFTSSFLFSQGLHYQAVIRDNSGSVVSSQLVEVQFTILDGAAEAYSESHSTTTDPYGQINLVIGSAGPEAFDELDWAGTEFILQVDVNTGSGFVTVSKGPFQSVPYAKGVQGGLKLDDLLDVNAPNPAEFDWLLWDGAQWVAGQYFENQALSLSGNDLSISGGNTVTLPTLGGGEVYSAGSGIAIANNVISNTGDTDPSNDVTTMTQAGGDLTGTFSNLQIKPGAVGSNEIADGTIQPSDLAPGTIPVNLPPGGSAGGDLSGTFPNPTVSKIQGRSLSSNAPTSGQVIKWNGTAWAPAPDETGAGGGDITAVTAGTGLSGGGASGDVILTAQNGMALWNANQIQGRGVSASAPTNGQVIKWTGSTWAPASDETGLGGDITAVNAGTGLSGGGASGDVTLAAQNATALWNANKIQGKDVTVTNPAFGQVIAYDGTKWVNALQNDGDWISQNDPLRWTSTLPVQAAYMGLGVTPNSAYSLRCSQKLDLAGSGVILTSGGTEALWYNGDYFSWGFGANWNYFAKSVGIGQLNPTHILHVNGIARSSQASWATSSDRRVKQNIEPIIEAMPLIRKFNPVTFHWTDSYRKTHQGLKENNYGFIAQEVEKIIPEMVTKVEDEINDIKVNDFRVLSTDALVPLLVKAVQEQQQTIEDQHKLIINLEQRLGALEHHNTLVKN